MSKANRLNNFLARFNHIEEQAMYGLSFSIAGFILGDFIFRHTCRAMHISEYDCSAYYESLSIWLGLGIGMLAGIGYSGHRYLKQFKAERNLYKYIICSVIGFIAGLALFTAIVYVFRNNPIHYRLENLLGIFIPFIGALIGFNFRLP